jgi:hypothetical protein
MVDGAALRRELEGFLGRERFEAFVGAGMKGGRLRFWQEQEWKRFVAGRPAWDVGMAALAEALRFCVLHRRELVAGEAEVVKGHVDYSPHYLHARALWFPCAHSGPVYTEGAACAMEAVRVWYCEECRAAEWRWARGKKMEGER